MSTFPKIVDCPDFLEVVAYRWNEDVLKTMSSKLNKDFDMVTDQTVDFIMRLYPVFFTDEFNYAAKDKTKSMIHVKETYD